MTCKGLQCIDVRIELMSPISMCFQNGQGYVNNPAKLQAIIQGIESALNMLNS